MEINIGHWDFIGINTLNLVEDPFPEYKNHFRKTKIIIEPESALSFLQQIKLKVQDRLSLKIKEEGELDLGNPLLILVNEPTNFYSSLIEEGAQNILNYIKTRGESVNIFYREASGTIPVENIKLPQVGLISTNRIKYTNN